MIRTFYEIETSTSFYDGAGLACDLAAVVGGSVDRLRREGPNGNPLFVLGIPEPAVEFLESTLRLLGYDDPKILLCKDPRIPESSFPSHIREKLEWQTAVADAADVQGSLSVRDIAEMFQGGFEGTRSLTDEELVEQWLRQVDVDAGSWREGEIGQDVLDFVRELPYFEQFRDQVREERGEP